MPSVRANRLDQESKMILFLIRSSGNVPVNETHLQKIFFQAMKILGMDPKDLGFRPHKYGPYSDFVNENKVELINLGFLKSDSGGLVIDPDAVEDVSTLRLSEDRAFKLRVMTEYFVAMSNDELLLMIYLDDIDHDGGRYLENSEVRKRVLNRRISTAIGMYERGMITLERSSELAGLDIRRFRATLISSGRYRY